MYFFRAYIYFNKLRALGDFPIITTMVGEDYETVRENIANAVPETKSLVYYK